MKVMEDKIKETRERSLGSPVNIKKKFKLGDQRLQKEAQNEDDKNFELSLISQLNPLLFSPSQHIKHQKMLKNYWSPHEKFLKHVPEKDEDPNTTAQFFAATGTNVASSVTSTVNETKTSNFNMNDMNSRFNQMTSKLKPLAEVTHESSQYVSRAPSLRTNNDKKHNKAQSTLDIYSNPINKKDFS